MSKKFYNEILEEGQIVVIRRNEHRNEFIDGYGILIKRVHQIKNQEVWSMWWSAIGKNTFIAFTQPEPMEHILGN